MYDAANPPMQRSPVSSRTGLFHCLLWLLGIAAAFPPYYHQWAFLGDTIILRNGPGSFALNILVATGLVIVSAMVWGGIGIWTERLWLAKGKRLRSIAPAAFVATLTALGFWNPTENGLFGAAESRFSGADYYTALCLIAILWSAWLFFSRPSRRNALAHMWELLITPKLWNALFYALLLIVFVSSLLLTIYRSDEITGLHAWSLAIGRIGVSTTLVALMFFVIRGVKTTAPTAIRWLVWPCAGVLPVVAIADFQLLTYWNQSLFPLLNTLTNSGRFDLAHELTEAKAPVSALTVYLLLLATFVLCGALSLYLWRISHRWGLKIAPLTVIIIALAGAAITTGEQVLGQNWKTVSAWQAENRYFDIQLSPVQPPLGLAEFNVKWRDAQIPPALPESASRPDIYIFMVETFRADAINPKSAPFLTRFAADVAQPIQTSLSASNGTHLSWFSFFHSRNPVHWRDEMDLLAEDETYPGSPWLVELKDHGYDIHVASACDLAYKSFGMLNFGRDYSLATTLIHSDEDSELSNYNSADREVMLLEGFKSQLPRLEKGGNFHFFAFDSSHYNYYWHRDFEPPYSDFDDPIQLPSDPTPEQRDRAWNRYLNSVAWMDQLIANFVEVLKAEGRYEDSVIVITGDHGEEFQEAGGWFHCSSLRPEQTFVPLLIKWPNFKKGGPKVSMASAIDFMPSLFASLGTESRFLDDATIGQNLLNPAPNATTLRATTYTGKSNEAAVLESPQYRAAFTWSRPWDGRKPDTISLLSLRRADGTMLDLTTPEEYRSALYEAFPDIDRFIDSLTPAE